MRTLPSWTPALFLYTTLAVVITLGIVFAPAESEETKPVSFIKEEYVRCIEHEPDSEMIAQCLGALAAYAYNHYETTAITAQLDTLSYSQKNHWCHEVMHYMGWQAYEAQQDVATAFLGASELCDSGMYHGIMEEYLREHGLSGNIEALIASICEDSLARHPDLSNGTKSLCYHGLGHGLMFITSSDLQASLDYCDAVEDRSDAENCYSGAFMEYIISKELGPLENRRDLEDARYCQSLKAYQKESCYFRQGLNNLSAAGGDVGAAMELCLRLEDTYQNTCFRGVGSNTPTPGRSHADSGIACKSALEVSEDAYKGCVYGGLRFVLQLDRGDMQGALDFCSVVEEAYKNYCHYQAGAAAQPWVTSEEPIETKCVIFTGEKAQDACKTGAAGKLL